MSQFEIIGTPAVRVLSDTQRLSLRSPCARPVAIAAMARR
jgi:hypothetical protein